VHNAFARDWMNEYYRPALLEATTRVLGSPREIQIEVDPERIVALPPEKLAPAVATPSPIAPSDL
jgi:hypothetical protein